MNQPAPRDGRAWRPQTLEVWRVEAMMVVLRSINRAHPWLVVTIEGLTTSHLRPSKDEALQVLRRFVGDRGLQQSIDSAFRLGGQPSATILLSKVLQRIRQRSANQPRKAQPKRLNRRQRRLRGALRSYARRAQGKNQRGDYGR